MLDRHGVTAADCSDGVDDMVIMCTIIFDIKQEGKHDSFNDSGAIIWLHQ